MDEFTDIQDTPSVVELVESVDNLNLCPYEEYQKLCKKWAGKIYPIKEKGCHTRLALIISHLNNTVFHHLSPWLGAKRDIAEMKKLLESLGYTVHVKMQLTAKEMDSALMAFADLLKHITSDSMFLVLMSHGLLEGICGTMHSDAQPDVLPYDTVFSIFNNRNCSRLMDKPKVLVIQACCGKSSGVARVSDYAAGSDSPRPLPENLQEDFISRTHIEKDFIAFYSSTPHNMSWKDTEMGSPFITQIVTYFQKNACRLHLEEIFCKASKSFT
ncbi:LOW QUALITY PROTEIN: caspase-13-like [Suncus etruscus]|uniref:LOW QUALITY PROTEIN: caspase-13-like n=1 Tax=Suncus etruscus TaxID=109475 RepID=UPI002110D46A|nr:LOW QUALITY PROTEIN: caspase-13-like [Suncus etruscus]